ncbi:translation elongation factor 4 [Meiothermus taiwanensis]|uniref:Elongation factor 4 n=2 Tax=Meiothermus taiwanensis TaxID=172827 RepID=A0A399E7W2_9DEIN|nr:translation elongation factor 4 [Meiothermus taiwanensis]AWR87637.1 GTP-binding protein LepA [Meiothermus taiwanensis WR-220]KIQ55109.1 GTP-binding protein LepA [Meiothermus taiwanensis]KZK16711.1 elongation factor 4 [Meiothermus taiwanensis]RIH79259.1 Elongation factor 4 [Meiothermus taiwanensis]
MQERIRNFSIIAHVDHGKSTLADRILQMTKAVSDREMREQFLDSLELERERGITIKASAVRLFYQSKAGETYIFNLIDTPGHVDFGYEVSRALAAVEGVLLVVDASQGVEAQTIANFYLAMEHEHTIIPVINKIDLPGAQPLEVALEVEEVLGIPADECIFASGKTGQGVDEILEAIVARIPAPKGHPEHPLQALIFDSIFDAYQGVIPYVRVMDGSIQPGDRIRIWSTGKVFEVDKVGVFRPGALEPVARLGPGEVGWITAAIREIGDAQVGDTITLAQNPCDAPYPGFQPAKPVVFAGLYPTDTQDYNRLREALEKLKLNDAALSFEPETSEALGFGFRCGFLGLLHAEIVQERLEREFDLDLISTAPSVIYRVKLTNGEEIEIHNPSELPNPDKIEAIYEPYVKLTVYTPEEYVGSIMQLLQEKRGKMGNMHYVGKRVEMVYEVPFGEILYDFHDRLKSLSRGYASMDYEQAGYQEGELVKVSILVNEEPVDALAFIAHKDKAYGIGREIVDKLAEVIPRQQFAVPIQAAIGGKIIARATVKALRKDVLAKCYGGDITRKKKLLEKQKEGKKRMKAIGKVDVPQEAFLAVLSAGRD